MLAICLMGVLFVTISLLLSYALVMAWQIEEPAPGGVTETFLGIALNAESRLFFVTLMAGAIGSYVHAVTSFVSYLGNRQLKRTWIMWYMMRPFIGMGLALIIYLVIRGGLFTGAAGADSVNTFGVAAIAGLAGMFSKQAIDKLRELFDNVFATRSLEDENRADKMFGAEETTIVSATSIEKVSEADGGPRRSES